MKILTLLFWVFFISLGIGSTLQDGRNYFSQGKYEKARLIFQDIVQQNSTNSSEAQFLIGQTYYYQGYFAASVKNFQKVLTFTNSSFQSKALLWIGSSYYHLAKDYQKAIDKYYMVVNNYKKTQDGFTAYLQIGRCYIKLNNIEKAREIFMEMKSCYTNTDKLKQINFELSRVQ